MFNLKLYDNTSNKHFDGRMRCINEYQKRFAATKGMISGGQQQQQQEKQKVLVMLNALTKTSVTGQIQDHDPD